MDRYFVVCGRVGLSFVGRLEAVYSRAQSTLGGTLTDKGHSHKPRIERCAPNAS